MTGSVYKKSGLFRFEETKIKISEAFKKKRIIFYLVKLFLLKLKLILAKSSNKNLNFSKVCSTETKIKTSANRGTSILYIQKIVHLLINFFLLERQENILMLIVKQY